MALTTFAEAKAELTSELRNYDNDIEALRDDLGSYVDSALPIYNSHIIDEWREMPGDYDGRGVAEFGAPEQITVYALMTLDLLTYYLDLFNEALAEIENELESEAA